MVLTHPVPSAIGVANHVHDSSGPDWAADPLDAERP
jgi:hypothetical protein